MSLPRKTRASSSANIIRLLARDHRRSRSTILRCGTYCLSALVGIASDGIARAVGLKAGIDIGSLSTTGTCRLRRLPGSAAEKCNMYDFVICQEYLASTLPQA